MYNLLISAGVAVLIGAVVKLAGFSIWAAIIPALIGLVGTYFVLARRILVQIQALGAQAQKELQARKFDKAVKIFEDGFKLEKWQFGVASTLHTNIGMLQYITREFDAAKPHLEKAYARGPDGSRAKAMLACLHYMKKDTASMTRVFEEAVAGGGKKEPIVWAIYAWCLDKLDKRDDAIQVLGRAVEANPSDEKLKAQLTALQNEKKMKMKAFTPEWYQYHLEKPPMDMGPGGGRRVVYQRR